VVQEAVVNEFFALAAALVVGWLLGRVTRRAWIVPPVPEPMRQAPPPKYPRLVSEDKITNTLTYEQRDGSFVKVCGTCGGNCGLCGRGDVTSPAQRAHNLDRLA
jgi:hypothetical protein